MLRLEWEVEREGIPGNRWWGGGLAGSIPEPFCRDRLSSLAPPPGMRLLHRRLLHVVVPLKKRRGRVKVQCSRIPSPLPHGAPPSFTSSAARLSPDP